ncbi:hypothetical protein FB451DRAFT_1528538 [Mycena latifolia]|nr:hypothetical protein FB451DRAFT_1528538 [Mycena latifolia]
MCAFYFSPFNLARRRHESGFSGTPNNCPRLCSETRKSVLGNTQIHPNHWTGIGIGVSRSVIVHPEAEGLRSGGCYCVKWTLRATALQRLTRNKKVQRRSEWRRRIRTPLASKNCDSGTSSKAFGIYLRHRGYPITQCDDGLICAPTPLARRTLRIRPLTIPEPAQDPRNKCQKSKIHFNHWHTSKQLRVEALTAPLEALTYDRTLNLQHISNLKNLRKRTKRTMATDPSSVLPLV